MKTRKIMFTLMVCVLVMTSIAPPAGASEVPDESVIWLEDLAWERIDLSVVEYCEAGPMPLTTDQISKPITKHSIGYITPFMDLIANDVVTFNCSYSPSSASVDFGVVTSSGRFYSINVKGGSINQSIGISQAGSYAVAIRNNSSQTVRVVGFVDY